MRFVLSDQYFAKISQLQAEARVKSASRRTKQVKELESALDNVQSDVENSRRLMNRIDTSDVADNLVRKAKAEALEVRELVRRLEKSLG